MQTENTIQGFKLKQMATNSDVAIVNGEYGKVFEIGDELSIEGPLINKVFSIVDDKEYAIVDNVVIINDSTKIELFNKVKL